MSAEYLLLEDDPLAAIARAAQVLNTGGIVIFPTDTVYGLLAAMDCAAAYRRIYKLKQRPLDKPLALLAAAEAPLAGLAIELLNPFTAEQQRFAQGALTLLIDSADIPDSILPATVRSIQPGSVGVRLPRHDTLQALLSQLGGLAWATSANAAGEIPAATEEQVLRWASRLASPPELVITSIQILAGHPSELKRLHDGKLHRLTR